MFCFAGGIGSVVIDTSNFFGLFNLCPVALVLIDCLLGVSLSFGDHNGCLVLLLLTTKKVPIRIASGTPFLR